MPVLTAHYGESPYKSCLYGDFLNLYGGGQQKKKDFQHRNHISEPTLMSNIDPNHDPNMPEHLLRP